MVAQTQWTSREPQQFDLIFLGAPSNKDWIDQKCWAKRYFVEWTQAKYWATQDLAPTSPWYKESRKEFDRVIPLRVDSGIKSNSV